MTQIQQDTGANGNTIVCSECGSVNYEGDKYCAVCGSIRICGEQTIPMKEDRYLLIKQMDLRLPVLCFPLFPRSAVPS